jgi:transposase
VRQLLQGRYRRAKRVHLVLDNLNTHFAKGFIEVLRAKRAERLLKRVVFHYTPTHASWLNMAEIEIGSLDKQYLKGRIASAEQLTAAVDAWQKRRNQQKKTINWTFTRQDADKKLGKHYLA